MSFRHSPMHPASAPPLPPVGASPLCLSPSGAPASPWGRVARRAGRAAVPQRGTPPPPGKQVTWTMCPSFGIDTWNCLEYSTPVWIFLIQPLGFQMENHTMTIRQVAEYLQVTQKTIYKLSWAGTLPGFKVGNAWRFKREDIDRWIEAKKRKLKGSRR
jgi:excisionase family DNA binding protein